MPRKRHTRLVSQPTPISIQEILYTTRAMRRLRTDAVPDAVIARILDSGLRAPSGGNTQDWRFMIVTDRDKIAAIAPLYQAGLSQLFEGHYKQANAATRAAMASGTADRRTAQLGRVLDSSEHLAAHFADVPLLVFGYLTSRENAGSIWPALWSMCLAARAEGVGSTVTTILEMFAAKEVDEILGVPDGSGFYRHACLPMGYPTGRWGVPDRKPVSKVVYHNTWGTPPAFAPSEPLWSPHE